MPHLKKIGDAHIQDIESNLAEARRIGIRFVDFTGGEPLLHNELSRMLTRAKELKLKTSVTTNCLLYPQRAGELAGLIDYLHFSLDSGQAAQHDAIRGKKVFFRVMESIEVARSLGEKPDLLFTVTAENVDTLESLVKLAQKLRLMLIINPVFSHREKHDLSGVMMQKFEAFSFRPYVYLNTAFIKLRRNGGNSVKNPRCRVVTSTVVISPDNRLLLPCFHFAQRSLPISGSLRLLRKGEEFERFRALQGRFDFCRGCTLNCYFDPSFLYKPDGYFYLSMLAKAKYVFDKRLRRLI